MLFGVTVLTSFMPGEMPGITAAPAEYALALARGAQNWGLDGVVCSGHETREIKAALPGRNVFARASGGRKRGGRSASDYDPGQGRGRGRGFFGRRQTHY